MSALAAFMYVTTATWVGHVLQAAVINSQQNGNQCRGNVQCLSKCCFIPKDYFYGICINPPAGMTALCAEQQVSYVVAANQSNRLQLQGINPNELQGFNGALQTPQLQQQSLFGLPNPLITTASQGTTVTGAYVYMCNTCESKCCCGTSCCESTVCSTVGSSVATSITGTLCTGCLSFCCCNNQCCDASNCGFTRPLGTGTSASPGLTSGLAPGANAFGQSPAPGTNGAPPLNIYDLYLLNQLTDYYQAQYQNQLLNNYRNSLLTGNNGVGYPNQQNVLPQQQNFVTPQPNLNYFGSQANNYVPPQQQSNFVPQQNNFIPQQSNFVTQQGNYVPPQNNYVPPSQQSNYAPYSPYSQQQQQWNNRPNPQQFGPNRWFSSQPSLPFGQSPPWNGIPQNPYNNFGGNFDDDGF